MNVKTGRTLVRSHISCEERIVGRIWTLEESMEASCFFHMLQMVVNGTFIHGRSMLSF